MFFIEKDKMSTLTRDIDAAKLAVFEAHNEVLQSQVIDLKKEVESKDEEISRLRNYLNQIRGKLRDARAIFIENDMA